MAIEDVLSAFASIFRGNTLFFVKHQKPFTLSNDDRRKLEAKWCGFAVYNKRDIPPSGKEAGDLIPLTLEKYREHLNGGDGLAVSPVMNVEGASGETVKRNVCYFATVDVDIYDYNYTSVVKRLYEYGFRFVPVISKSMGLHIHFIFREAESAKCVIETLERFVNVFGLNKLFITPGKQSKVEIFPKQASFVPGSSNANCIFLPFYNSAGDAKFGKMLTSEGKLVGIVKAIPLMETLFTTLSEINASLDALPYSDAPFCIQMLLLIGWLEEGSMRNNFLFSAGIYLKKKYKTDFFDAFIEMNSYLGAPLDEDEISSIYKSLTDGATNYENYSCNKAPCVDYCDKKLCALRKYSPKKEKDGYLTGASCLKQITRVVDARGEVQHYVWEMQVNEGDGFKKVRIDNVEDFESQSKIRTACRRDLHWAPNIVNQKVWIDLVNDCMAGIEERTQVVAKGTETSEDSLLWHAVMRYLTHKQIQNGQPFLIKTGQVYRANGMYYFTTDGLIRFLTVEKVPLHKLNLHAKLVSFGCVEGEITYKTAKGIEIKISCWKKEEDDELKAMDAFYEDIYDSGEDIIQKNEKEGIDGDIRF